MENFFNNSEIVIEKYTTSSFFHQPSALIHLSLYTKNHDPIAEVVIVVDVDQRRFSSTAEGKVNRPVICLHRKVKTGFGSFVLKQIH